MKFIDFWKLGTMPADYVKFILKQHNFQFILPIESVLRNPEDIFDFINKWPSGRSWATGLYCREKFIPYEELCKLPDFKGTASEQELYIIECWEDRGSDGHVEYRMVGHILCRMEMCEIIDNMNQEAISNMMRDNWNWFEGKPSKIGGFGE